MLSWASSAPTHAPFWIRNVAASAWPLAAAKCSGVRPSAGSKEAGKRWEVSYGGPCKGSADGMEQNYFTSKGFGGLAARKTLMACWCWALPEESTALLPLSLSLPV